MTKVCLIDGSGYIFRAFYALPNMTAPDGTPVNAVYGFVTMFMRLLKNIDCDYCVVLFDAKRQNYRNEIFADYKANRAETPELLIPQFDLIHQAVNVLNISYVLQEGYEADDLIATYAKQAESKGFETVVVSADKDLMQLIGGHVSYYDGMKDKFFTPEDVKEKFGVYPDKVVDVQALSGDKIDNIPGVPGIGPKTAAELVNTYGSLEGVLQNIDNIKQEKRRELLRTHQNDARISLQLVTLNNAVPVEHTLDEFKCRAPQVNEVLAFADRLGFKSIRPKLEAWAVERAANCDTAPCESDKPIPPQPTAKNNITVTSPAQLTALQQEIETAQQFAFQVLHNGREVCGFCLCCAPNKAYYLPFSAPHGDDLFSFGSANESALPSADVLKFLQSLFNDKSILKITAELKTQWHLLNKLFAPQTLDLFPYDDISVMSYVLDSSEHLHSLPALCEVFLNESITEPKTSAKNPIIDFTAAEYGDYRFAAGESIYRLHRLLKPRLISEHRTYVYEMLERRLVQVLLEMEEAGIIVNKNCLSDLDAAFKAQMSALEKEIYALAGREFNLASPKQIGDILFTQMGLKGKKNASGSFNTSAGVLEKLAEENEIAAKILEWRTYAKLQTTYTTALLAARDANGRVHTTFSQTVVNTGRLASSNPNLQNIPNRTAIGQKIRACFEARDGYQIVAADYSQMELRLLASVADVKALKEAFAAGVDIHAATAARVFGLAPDQVDKEHRSRAKAINFGIVYGISQFGLARQLGISREQAKAYIDSYFAIMPEVKEYMARTIAFAHQNGYVLTPFGRKCTIFGINDSNHNVSSFAERAAINAPIQGGAADIVKLAMQRVAWALKEQNLDARLLLQVHDELVLEVKDSDVDAVKTLLKQIMENAVETSVPMIVDVGVGKNWHDAH